jgi:hydrogenase large subunit
MDRGGQRMTRRIMFSPVTRLSGLLSVEVTVDGDLVIGADVSSTMFRGFERIMQKRHITDAVYMTQRVCGICSLAHGATASYLLDEIYDNDIPENAQYLRNIMYGADFLQNHIRHFYVFSLPDFVIMPDRPPFHGQRLADARLNSEDNRRLVEHYFEGIRASQKCHQILAIFGGKAPHQHSFLHGGVSVGPAADNINQALSLMDDISAFVRNKMMPDTELLARAYGDYFHIGITPRRFLSFGLFKFGGKNEEVLWKGGVLSGDRLTIPDPQLINEDITSTWLDDKEEPDPNKPRAYTWVKSVQYEGRHYEVGPLVRMILNREYSGGSSTMDRIYARSLETMLITDLVRKWLRELRPGPPPLSQKKEPIKADVTATTDAMRGALLHKARIEDQEVKEYNIITPTAWNFSPKDKKGDLGPVETALIGTHIPKPNMVLTVLGRIIRSFDPCMSCGTHVLDCQGNITAETIL